MRDGRLADVAPPGWIRAIARAGLAAKGVIYVLVGLLGVRAAVHGGRTRGPGGAIREIGAQPFGRILLVAVAVGLAAYMAWRLIEAWFDPDRRGTRDGAVVVRTGIAISGLVYGGLAFSALSLALGRHDAAGEGAEKAWTARVMSHPFGIWIVGLVGAVVIGVAAAQFVNAWRAAFMRHYAGSSMRPEERRVAVRIGRTGHVARGIAFALVGAFLVGAARHANPREAEGLGGALAQLVRWPGGWWLMGATAIGLAVYGVHCLWQARFRPFT